MLKYLIKGPPKRSLATSIAAASEVVRASEVRDASPKENSPDAKRKKSEAATMDEADQSSLTSSGGSLTVQKSLVIQSEETCSEMGVEPLKEVNAELSNATCTATCIATSKLMNNSFVRRQFDRLYFRQRRRMAAGKRSQRWRVEGAVGRRIQQTIYEDPFRPTDRNGQKGAPS